MYEIRYWLAKLQYKLRGNDKEVMSKYFRKAGMRIGGGCNICCNIMTPEAYLIDIGDDVTIAGNVVFVTHDNSIIKIDPKCANLFGYIKIGNNCFIGQNTTLLYGVSLADNIIVAAGSVVANSFTEQRIIVAGNPARKIGTWDEFYKNNGNCAMGRNTAFKAANDSGESDNRFIKRKTK